MLVGVCGGICAGKHTVAEYLVQQHGFLRLHLPTKPASLFPDHDEQDAKRLLPTVADEKGTRGLTFPDADALLDFVTRRWREHWVLTDIWDDAILELLLRRPFFMLISVDAPVGIRYLRFSARCAKRSLSPPSLVKFISWSDAHLYAPDQVTHLGAGHQRPHLGVAYLSSRAHLQILNQYTNLLSFHTYLERLAVTSPDRLRPTWDAYFMTLASLAAQRSNCMKRRVGCVLATATHRVISTGYNGTPRGVRNCNEGGCDRCNKGPGAGAGLSTCLCLHAEENALLEAGRERIREGSILYCDTCPCLTCSVKITQVGISEVVFNQSYNMDDASAAIFTEAGVKLRQFSPPRSGLIHFDHGDDVEIKNEQAMVKVVRNGHA